MTTQLDIYNRALQMIGERTTIASLSEDSAERRNCDLIYEPIRKQALEAAPWNFARRTRQAVLVKGLPGAPGIATTTLSQWTPLFPAPSWLYEYQYPTDCLRMRYVTPQMSNQVSVPVFGASYGNYSPYWTGPPCAFIVASDVTGTQNSASHYADCSTTQIKLNAADVQADDYYNGMQIYVNDGNGHFGWGTVVDYVGATNIATFAAMTGLTFGTNLYYYLIGNSANVILTNQQTPLLTYIANITDINLYSEDFIQCICGAMAAYLAAGLTGMAAMVKLNVEIANRQILSARQSDGNEGITVQDTIPDWLAARQWAFPDNFIPPYTAPFGPLFVVS